MLFGIIGGDRRQEELLALLRRDGYKWRPAAWPEKWIGTLP